MNETPVAVGPLPKAYYALEAYTDETWKMVTVVFSVIKIMLRIVVREKKRDYVGKIPKLRGGSDPNPLHIFLCFFQFGGL